MKATIDQVREFIRHANAKELKLVSEIVSSRFKHLQAELSFDFTPGDKVWFIKGKRSPRRITGEVVSADGRWIFIKADGVPCYGGWNWKVAPSLLNKVEG